MEPMDTLEQELASILQAMKAKTSSEGLPDASVRIDRLDRCIGLLVDHQDALIDAMAEDFGTRAREASRLTDIAASIGALKHARAHVRRWMRPERVSTTPALLGLFGARARIEAQPKGVVGLIAPWNFPVFLVFGPLAGILAAGNRAMIKPSELTPRTSALLKTLIEAAFAPDEVVVVTGGSDVGQAFAAQAFDHLVFTGGARVGRMVLAAAAKTLTPVTLELGGKCPAIVSSGADLGVAAARIMNGKTLNAGQICLAPDYALVPADRVDAFADAASQAVAAMFPKLTDSPDYASIIDARSFSRLAAYVEDARAKGARILELRPEGQPPARPETRQFPPTLILDATPEMAVMQEEIFGPILPVVAYDQIENAVAHVNARDAPLAVYWFGSDRRERDFVLSHTRSGGVTINDVIFHVAQEGLPFGGVGPSGFGAYQGRDGFLEFSHRRSIFEQVPVELGPLRDLRPPFGPAIRKYLAGRIRR
ncbi:coniferyl aldehyde dehydrogenase [Brevundimonas intermedia]